MDSLCISTSSQILRTTPHPVAVFLNCIRLPAKVVVLASYCILISILIYLQMYLDLDEYDDKEYVNFDMKIEE